MSYPSGDGFNPVSVISYPLNSIIGSGGAPRFGLVQRDRNVSIESGRMSPVDPLHGGRLPGNVVSPALPEYLRNSLYTLDTWEANDEKARYEQEIAALEEGLSQADMEAQADLDRYMEGKKVKLTHWQTLGIAGFAVAIVGVIYLIWTKYGR